MLCDEKCKSFLMTTMKKVIKIAIRLRIDIAKISSAELLEITYFGHNNSELISTEREFATYINFDVNSEHCDEIRFISP